MRIRTARLVAVLTAALAVAAGLGGTASASTSSYGDRLASLINQARAQQGLPALTVTSGTSSVATSWTQHLAAAGALSHNPDLGSQLESHGSAHWTSYGENVGDGPASSAQALFDAYMSSPEHRANILGSSYRYLGVGVVFTGSTAWNTLDFVDQYAGTSATSRSAGSPAGNRTAVTHPAHVRAAPVRPHLVSRPAPTRRVAAATIATPTVEALASTLPATPTALHRVAVAAARGTRSADRRVPLGLAAGLIVALGASFARIRPPARRMTRG